MDLQHFKPKIEMHVILKSGYVKARKEHYGEGSDYFDFANKRDGYDINEFKDLGLTDEEIQTIQDAKARKWRIAKGEIYHSQTGVYDGDLYVYKAIKGIHEICVKYDLYRED